MSRTTEVFALFTKLGAIAFGGPAAHIALLETEVVERRGWIDREHFLDLVGATQLVPGPNSTEMALHVGWERGRWSGLIAAGLGFIGPAVAITLICAWLYVELGTLPAADAALAGIQPVVIAVILGALWRLGQKSLRDTPRWLIAVGVCGAVLLGAPEVPTLFAGALLGTGLLRWHRPTTSSTETPKPPPRGLSPALVLAPTPAVATATTTAAAASTTGVGLWPLSLFFLKVGAVLYGSGYVLIAFLEGELVQERGWLTSAQLLDAVAVGQLTPGPVLTTATFVGYVLAGIPGALVASLAIFLPSFVFVALLNPVIPRLRRGTWTAAFLDAVNAAAVALMAAVTLNLAAETLVSWPRVVLFAAAAVGLQRTKIHPAWWILGGAASGLALGPWLG